MLPYCVCKIYTIKNAQNCFSGYLKSPRWGNHIKGNQNFSTMFKDLLFLNEVIFSKFINL